MYYKKTFVILSTLFFLVNCGGGNSSSDIQTNKDIEVKNEKISNIFEVFPLESDSEIHTIGVIPKIKNKLTIEEVNQIDIDFNNVIEKFNNLEKSYRQKGFNEKESFFKSLNQMVKDKDILAYKWGRGALYLYNENGEIAEILYSSIMMGGN